MTGPFLANAVEIAGEWVPELLGLFNGIYCEHFFILGIGRIRGNLGVFFSSALFGVSGMEKYANYAIFISPFSWSKELQHRIVEIYIPNLLRNSLHCNIITGIILLNLLIVDILKVHMET